jgi:hypothetical protein
MAEMQSQGFTPVSGMQGACKPLRSKYAARISAISTSSSAIRINACLRGITLAVALESLITAQSPSNLHIVSAGSPQGQFKIRAADGLHFFSKVFS